MQKFLQTSWAASPHTRQIQIKWLPAHLSFPFSSKAILGCLVGFNLTDRYELFDEENLLSFFQKDSLGAKVVKESSYCHSLSNPKLRIYYFEIEGQNSGIFSLSERTFLQTHLEKFIRQGVQKLAPTVFMRRNEEEVYKTILTLSREIRSVHDIPQAWISFETQSKKEIAFLIILVYASPKSRLEMCDCFRDSEDYTFVSERVIPVRRSKKQQIEAHVFRLHLPLTYSLTRSDGSINFYASRQRVVSLLTATIGEFRDYNGGTLIKQQELLEKFKSYFPSIAETDAELMETFFYGITPLEKQTLIKCDLLATLFQDFLTNRDKKLARDVPYAMQVRRDKRHAILSIQACGPLWKETILEALKKPEFETCDWAYTIVDTSEGVFFHAALLFREDSDQVIQTLQEILHHQHQKIAKRQILRIGAEFSLVSLDPRIGGDLHSSNVLRFLFEGLTRFDKNGKVEKGIAQAIDVSPDLQQYTFKLRSAEWNDGSPVTAYDFEYAWKKILSPNFKTAYAYLFDPIKNAKEAKEGKVSVDQVGIFALDALTLRVELVQPTQYFLELTAQPLYYPVHQETDQKHPQWPYQTGEYYPCNGPFALAVNDPSHQTYRFVRNTRYWNAKEIQLDEVLLAQMNPYRAFQAFQRGELDWIGNPFGSWYPFYTAGPRDQQITIPNATSNWLAFNTEHSPFHHPKIRQAIALAIHREQLVANASLPLIPAYRPFLPSQQCGAHTFFPIHNAEMAQQLLKEGLCELGMSKQDFCSMVLLFNQGGVREDIASKLVDQLRNSLDIEVVQEPLPWRAVYAKLMQGEFHIALVSWTSLTNDLITTLNVFRDAKDDMNLSKWDNPEFRQWLKLSEQTANPSERAYALLQAAKCFCHEMPIVPLYYQQYQALVRSDLNAVWNAFGDLTRSSF